MGKKKDMKKYKIFERIVKELKIKGNMKELLKIYDLIVHQKRYLTRLDRDQKRKRDDILQWFESNEREVAYYIGRIKIINGNFYLPNENNNSDFQEEDDKTDFQEKDDKTVFQEEDEKTDFQEKDDKTNSQEEDDYSNMWAGIISEDNSDINTDFNSDYNDNCFSFNW